MTPQTISVDEAKGIIDRLANKELSFGCKVVKNDDLFPSIVLEKWSNQYHSEYLTTWNERWGENKGFLLGERGEKLNYTLKILGHPVLIGDVLERIQKQESVGILQVMPEFSISMKRLLSLWEPCGFTKSLNQILEEAEKEYFDPLPPLRLTAQRLKPNTPASNLFLFLNQLFN